MYEALSLWRRLRRLPPVVRDCGAVLLVLGLFMAGAHLPLITIPGALLPLLPALLLAALAFGRNSALLAALLAALAVRQHWFGTVAGEAGSEVALLLMAALLAAALGVSGLLDAWHRRRAEVVVAHEQVDAAARRATQRLALAYHDLRQAEARLAQAERDVRNLAQQRRTARQRGQDAALDSAFRSEGGI